MQLLGICSDPHMYQMQWMSHISLESRGWDMQGLRWSQAERGAESYWEFSKEHVKQSYIKAQIVRDNLV